MKAKSIITIALGLVALSFTASAGAEYRCDKPRSFIDERACAKAKEGPRALAQFINRTRMIYGLYFWDYVAPQVTASRAGNAQAMSQPQRATN